MKACGSLKCGLLSFSLPFICDKANNFNNFEPIFKVGGTSLEQVFNGLTESRPPLCARRFMDSLEGCPAAKRDKGIGCAAARKVSTRGKYRNQHCLRNSSNLLWGHLSLDIEGAKHVNLPAASHMSTLSRRSLRLSRESKSSSIGRSRSWNDHSTRQLKTAVPSAPFVPPVYTMVILREPVARLVSLANYLGVSLSAFESNWAMKNAVNTQTAMVNGVPNIGPLNVNGHSHDRGSCVHSASEAITESRRRLLTTYTVAGTTETYVRTVWLTQRVSLKTTQNSGVSLPLNSSHSLRFRLYTSLRNEFNLYACAYCKRFLFVVHF
jgi:hypothetical protein